MNSDFDWRMFSPDDDGHYFFGYYDRNPWDLSGRFHLALKVAQQHRLPLPGETAEIGLLDREDPGAFRKLAVTNAWCHQQGCMELFLPRRPGCFVYNEFDEARRKLVGRIFELGKGVVGAYELPIYAISPDGRFGVSLNFGRIPRRGYSYAPTPVPLDEWHPADPDGDGIFLVDLDTGRHKLLVSYRTMLERHPYVFTAEDQYIWLNHAIFNSDSTRLLWLFRQTEDPVTVSKFWQTFMFTCSLADPADAECILPDTCWRHDITHQIWGHDPREIMIDAVWGHHGSELIAFDESRRPFIAHRISSGQGLKGHSVYSPDGRYILLDTYPNGEEPNKVQKLLLVESSTGRWRELGEFRHTLAPGTRKDLRCDLHPRWSPDGKRVTVDSIDGGSRRVYLLELPENIFA